MSLRKEEVIVEDEFAGKTKEQLIEECRAFDRANA